MSWICVDRRCFLKVVHGSSGNLAHPLSFHFAFQALTDKAMCMKKCTRVSIEKGLSAEKRQGKCMILARHPVIGQIALNDKRIKRDLTLLFTSLISSHQ